MTATYKFPEEIGGQQVGYVDQELLRTYLENRFPPDQFPTTAASGDRFQIRCVNDLISYWIPEAMTEREKRHMLREIRPNVRA